MAAQVYEFNVGMTCEGCASAVEKVLKEKEGVTDMKIDLEQKKVFVTSTLPPEEVSQTIKKTGNGCSFLGVRK